MSSKVTECKACKIEVSKSAKTCPHCGEKLKMGWFMKGIIGLVALIAIGVVLTPSEEEEAKKLASTLAGIASAETANISSTGELASAFKFPSKYTDLQRDKLEKEIIGQIVQWTLPVYEVDKMGEGYLIQTSGVEAILGGTPMVAADITVYPRNENEKSYIEALKTGDLFSFKGKIKGTTIRRIGIDPAIIISK